MSKILGIFFLVILTVGSANAQFSIGVNTIFLDQTILCQKYNNAFTSRGTGAEINAGFLSRGVSLRGYYLPSVNSSHQWSIIVDREKGTMKPMELISGFSATRLEIGLPMFFKDSIVEPFFVNSVTKHATTLHDGGLKFIDEVINNTSGLGLFYGQRIIDRQALYLKLSATPKDKVFDAHYNVVFRTCNFGAGYTYREYDNIKIKGPMLSIMLTF